MDVSVFLKALVEADEAPVVICNIEHEIVYINKTAAIRYASAGGFQLIGKSIKDCHSKYGSDRIDEVIEWFKLSKDNNIIYTYNNTKENKDVYMIALRDDDNKLIGYYEKHSFRAKETRKLYDYI